MTLERRLRLRPHHLMEAWLHPVRLPELPMWRRAVLAIGKECHEQH